MKQIKNRHFEGERPLFGARDLILENVTIHAGESALKECSGMKAVNCRFEGKYPFWHNDGFTVKNCLFTEGARAAIWYSKNLLMLDTIVEAPKMFRDASGVRLENVRLPNALETFWKCSDIELKNVSADKGDYLFMGSSRIWIEDFSLNGNYSFQYCRDVEIRNATINSKDAFWNSENVTVRDSSIDGEYLGWHTKNLRLINCKISGTQPLCYAKDLVMENCSMGCDADLCFEYSTLDASICGAVKSVKNPAGGRILAGSIGEIILDGNCRNPGGCEIRENARKSA